MQGGGVVLGMGSADTIRDCRMIDLLKFKVLVHHKSIRARGQA
jgi:hypothetical protein